MNEVLKISLIVNATCIVLSKLNSFYVGFEVVNTSSQLMNFDVTKTVLYINEKRSFSWDLTVSNGFGKTVKVKPNETEVITWPLGEALFQEKGKYVLELEYNGKIVNKKKVEVKK